jgi:hypothetical protein
MHSAYCLPVKYFDAEDSQIWASAGTEHCQKIVSCHLHMRNRTVRIKNRNANKSADMVSD